MTIDLGIVGNCRAGEGVGLDGRAVFVLETYGSEARLEHADAYRLWLLLGDWIEDQRRRSKLVKPRKDEDGDST